MVEKEPIRSN
ncbi:hypothetical protein Zm00014a_037780 [Zea mays]|uniref:Uncharacterized protein n=1 Tax=Zea mays TaxID=4577 RepID=A0A3L6DXK6_MAIZE|nr:hypothetical protein Zm00014a_037780 [Zea mays]